MILKLADFWDEVAQNHDIRAIVLTGSGDQAFSSGGDLGTLIPLMMKTRSPQGPWEEKFAANRKSLGRALLRDVPFYKPVIAAVNGHAYAGGLEMVLCCDFAYGVPQARFALTEVTIGIMPGAGGTQNLPRAVGERRAKEIILTGRPFSAQEALDWGVLNRVIEPQDLLPQALDTARRIAANAPLSVRQEIGRAHV